MFSLRRILWIGLWVLTLWGMYVGYQRGDAIFRSYVSSFENPVGHPAELIPPTVRSVVVSPHAQTILKTFRSTPWLAELGKWPMFKGILESFHLGRDTTSPFEQWIFQNWGTDLVVGIDPDSSTAYFVSKIGNEEQCLLWLRRALGDLKDHGFTWKFRKTGDHWCIELNSGEGWSGESHVQFYPVRGMAVLVIGSTESPMDPIFSLADLKEKSLKQLSGFTGFDEAMAHSMPSEGVMAYGMIRKPSDHEAFEGLEWKWVEGEDQVVHLDLKIPVGDVEESVAGDMKIRRHLYGRLHESNVMSILSSSADLKLVWTEVSRRLPESFRKAIGDFSVDGLLGEYHEIWDPVLEKSPGQFLVEFGEPEIISEKYKVPFPSFVITLPGIDRAAFLRAIEQTTLKANESKEAELLIRKQVVEGGEYYEIRMGDSAWRNFHGLKTLPVFAFVDDFLLIASSEAVLKQDLRRGDDLEAERFASEESLAGIHLRVRMKDAPPAIRILFAAFGLLNPQGDNIFLSPDAMEVYSHVFAVMDQMGQTDIRCVASGGHWNVQLTIHPLKVDE